MTNFYSGVALVKGTALFILALTFQNSNAEVVLDGSLGHRGNLPIGLQKTYTIDASLGQKLGRNLFHSFNQFSIESGETAHFTDLTSSPIEHVIARVTGGSPSDLNGTLKSSIAQANFYLINPAGILIGPDAKLDLPGAFYASTANSLTFEDGSHFDVLPETGKLLTSASPAAFGFLGNTHGSIRISGSKLNQQGQSFQLIGGDISINHSDIISAGGQIGLTSVSSSGQVSIDHSMTNDFTDWGDIKISHSSLDTTGEHNNHLWIETGNLLISDTSYLFADNKSLLPQHFLNSLSIHDSMTLDNSKLTNDSYQQGNASGIAVKVEKGLNLLNGGIIQTAAYDAGDAGQIQVNADTLLIQGEGQDDWGPSRIMSVAASGNGNANEVFVNVPRTLDLLDGALIGSNTTSLSEGNGGRVAIAAGDLTLSQGSVISGETWGQGKGSDVSVQAKTIGLDGSGQSTDDGFTGIFVTAERESTGSTGNLSVVADQTLQILNGAKISGTHFNTGQRGDVYVKAQDMLLDGMDSDIPTGIIVSAEAGSRSTPGKLDVIASRYLQIQRGAKINGTTWGSGQGNDVNVQADALFIDGSDTRYHTGIYASAMPGSVGDAGDVELNITKDLKLTKGAEISAFTQGQGRGGSVNITAGEVTLEEFSKIEALSSTEAIAGSVSIQSSSPSGTVNLLGNSQVSVESVSGDAGDVTVMTPRWLYLLNSAITTSANAGQGNGGNITIDPKFVILNQSAIIANAVQGNGGNIAIFANFFLPSIDSVVSASSQFGLQGTISIQSQYSNLANSIGILPGNLLDISNHVWDECGKVAITKGVSTFVVVGRGSLPITPDNAVNPANQIIDCGHP